MSREVRQKRKMTGSDYKKSEIFSMISDAVELSIVRAFPLKRYWREKI